MKSSSFIKTALILFALAWGTTACFDDLDTTPLDEDIRTADVVYDEPGAYKQVLAKLYASLAVTGQEGPAGLPDISGIDEGFSSYLRMYWYAQELTTDEAVIAWNDATIQDFHAQDWDAQDPFIAALYYRIFYTVSVCNEFIRETTDAKLDGRGEPADVREQVAVYRAEARFLRALAYYHALDLFRTVPFVTEADEVGSFFPEQISSQDLFLYIEEELQAIENELLAPKTNEYARVDQAAAWMLLAKLYLNADVYIGQDRYSDCADYSKRIIDGGYSLEPVYEHNFLADNQTSNEIIFPVAFDGNRTQTFGGMTFVINASIGGDMDPAASGVEGGWGGLRTTSAFVAKFPEVGGTVVEPVFGSGDYPLINVPGQYQGWDPENDETAVASINDDGIYEGYVFLIAEEGFKFADGGWETNWGDSDLDGVLEPAGGDIFVAEDGLYRIELNLNDLTYTLTKMSWGIIGDAVNGWDEDVDMTYDADLGAMVITTNLTAGPMKFRANDAWDINLGDTGADALLEYEGENIQIPGAGLFEIRLYLTRPDYTYSIISKVDDQRKFFFTDGQTLEIEDLSNFNDGYAITKFKNVTRDGLPGVNGNFPDTDYPLFRLSDAYLMYAEAVLRGGNGSLSEALGYVNDLRSRAGAGAIAENELTLDFLLDERARELYWEGHRRTDLVRFGQFTDGDYLWPWKGGEPEGVTVPSYRDIFPIPAADLGANPNLTQNEGY